MPVSTSPASRSNPSRVPRAQALRGYTRPPPDHALKKFGANVLARREARALTQEKLAELADLDRTYISSVERGIRNISLLSSLAIAKALKVPVAQLYEGID